MNVTSVMYQRTPLLSPRAETASSPFPRPVHLLDPALARGVILHDPRASDQRERSPSKVDKISLWRQASERPGTSLLQKPAFHSWCRMPTDDSALGIIGCLTELPLHLQGALELSQHRSQLQLGFSRCRERTKVTVDERGDLTWKPRRGIRLVGG